MTKRRPMGGMSRKHRARAEREQIQRRWILIGTILTISLVVGLLAYGWYDSRFVQPKIVIADVNGAAITNAEFQGRVRLIQRQLLAQLSSYIQMESLFAADPNTLNQVRTLQSQIQAQLSDVEFIGQQVLDDLIEDELIVQAARAQGIEVTREEIDRRIEREFGYFSEGTPTPFPTFTPVPTITPDATATAVALLTATPGASATPAPSSTPRPTPTEYTQEAFEQDYQTFLESLSDFQIREADYLAFVETQLFREKLEQSFEPELPEDQEQILVRHILLPDLETGEEALDKLEQGEPWDEIVLEYSQDINTNALEGLIGWRTLEELLTTYGQAGVAAFGTETGEISGPFQSDFGWHIFQVEDRESRPLSAEAQALAVDAAYSSYLGDLRENAEISIDDSWVNHLPQPIQAGS